MLKRTASISLIFAIIYFMSGSALWALQKAKTPQKQINTTRLNLFMKTTQSEATSLKQHIDSLRSSTSQNRLILLKKIVVKADTLLSSAEKLHAEVVEAGKFHLNESQNKAIAHNLTDLSTLIKVMQRDLKAGSVDFAANCSESPCLEAPCVACCHAQVTDPMLLDQCIQYCRAKADFCKALKELKEAAEEQSQNVRGMTRF